VRAGQVAGTLNSKGYICITVNGKSYKAHRLAWFFHYGVWPVNQIDHIDQNKTNNRINNLREVTNSQNKQNAGKYKCNTSGHKGVSFHKQHKKWAANIRVQRELLHLGYFPTPELASAAYKQAQEIHHTHKPQEKSLCAVTI
jgi:hypothetical protein